MITVISTIKTTIKTHITITWLTTRGALIALFAGLFILAACGGGGAKIDVDITTKGAACANPFDAGCGDAGAAARAEAINACRLLIETGRTCADTIPGAALVCLTDPYGGSCDVDAYNAAIRTETATVLIGALQTGRTNDCRGRTVAGVLLCNGAIVNTCDPISVATNDTRNQLILDNLCNNAPNYIAQRQDFIADCTDRDRLNNVGCTSQIVTCTDTPFNAECNVDVYDSYRAVACHASSTVNPQCGSIITNYCKNNIFGATAGCSTNSAFANARITECITGNNGGEARCQNTSIFTTAGLTECFEDPYGNGCDTVLGGNFNDAQNNHKTYCTGLGEERAADNTLCDAAIVNVCTGDSANIFDPLCFADNYQTLRETTCRTADVNSRDVRCPATVAQLCADNPFTRTVGGGAGYLCTDATARVDLVTRCASETGHTTGCDVTVGTVDLTDCIDNPHRGGCGDAVFNDLKTARFAHCTNDVPTKNCAGVEAIVCHPANQGEPLANPFHTLCRNSATNYSEIQRRFCDRLGRSAPPQCTAGHTADCIANPFLGACLAGNTFAVDRATIISNCLADATANAVDCERIVMGTTTVADCATNPFDTTNGCSTNAGFARTRTTRTVLCSATATPFDSLCNSFPSIAMARTAHCTTAETSFTTECVSNDYPETTTLRTNFCAQLENLFTELCDDPSLSGVARTALANLCFTNAEAEGCDQFANGVYGATIADCTSDLYNTANGCLTNNSFDALRRDRTTFCEPSAQYFNALCTDVPGINDDKEAYCTNGAGSFDANCASDYADDAAVARIEFARLCRSATTPRDDCANTSVAVGVSVADCVANPYRRECYGTEDNRNPDFIEEVAERDALCTGGDVYSPLCLLNDIEIVAGVSAARVAGCTTSARAAFNDNCTDAVYPGTESARRQYCSTDAQRNDVVDICAPYQLSICDDDINANPFAAICGDNAANQATFCMLDNNPSAQCSNDAAQLCPNDPFNPRAGIAGTTNCLTNSLYDNARATRCAAGTQGVNNLDNCKTSQVASLVCVARGPNANPFATFCESVSGVDLDVLKTARTAFADACAAAGAISNCVVESVQNALCSGSGDFLRPFSEVCNGVPTADAAKVSFCGRGDNVTEVDDCHDNNNEVIVSACRDDPFSTLCTNTDESYIDELQTLRAAHCASLTVADDLCSAVAENAVCAGYIGASGAVAANPLANLCAENIIYADPRRDACLGLTSQNTVCDGIEAVANVCRDNPFDATNPGCALLVDFDELKIDYCKGENTWLGICDTLAEAEEGVNEVATARVNACLEQSSGTTTQCEGLSESVTMACEATPFAGGCRRLIDTNVLAGYELAYCSEQATAWEDGCDDLVGTNAVDLARTQACTLLAEVPNNAESKCNDDVATIAVCEPTPFAPNFLGCKFLDRFEEFATNYCKAIGTAWEDDCNDLAEESGGVNDVVTARRDACLADPTVNAAMCPSVRTAYCSDTDNPANAFNSGCVNALHTGTSHAEQLQKACAEGGLGVNALCTDQTRAMAYCMENPFAGLGCDELSTIATIRMTYCTTTNPGAEGCDVTVACMRNPFDGRCVDESGTAYADARKTRADECRAGTQSGDDCPDRVTTCNNRPFGENSTRFSSSASTICNADPAFADARAALITKCIVVNAVQTDQDCKNAIEDQKAVSTTSCLENPYAGDALCAGATQLGSAGDVTKAQQSYCRATTGSTSFSDNCADSGVFPEDVIEAQVDSCLHSDSADGTCPTLITGFCTDTDEGSPFDDRCNESAGNHRTGNTFVRTTLCANGATDGKCEAIVGASFTAWADADEADTGADILDAGAGATDVNANFIKGVLNSDGNLHLGDNPDDGNSIIANTRVIRLNHDYTGDEASATPLRGDAEDGFVFAHADVADASTDRFFVGILHTTDLGRSVENNRGRALWKGVIQAFRYDGTSSYIHNADFVLSIDFDAGTLAFDGANGVVTLLGAPTLRISITTGTFDKTTGLITGEVLFADNTQDSSKTSTGILRGVIGREGAVGVFASPSTTETFGDFVGGFVASSADDLPVCVSLIEDPFGDNCSPDDTPVFNAQFEACSTGVLKSGSSVDPADCNHVRLSGVICSDSVATGSKADPFAQICSDDAITIFASVVTDTGFSADLTTLDAVTNPRSGDFDNDGAVDFDDVREKVRLYCTDIANAQDTVCVKRQAQLDGLSNLCIAGDEPSLFAPLCASYREFGAARALLCRNRANTASTTYNTYNCDTKDIITHLCTNTGAAANPFDAGICNKVDNDYLDERQAFAVSCAQNTANDPTATVNLNGADCSGANTACLMDPFSTECEGNENYDIAREDRKDKCRGDTAVKYSAGNIFNYDCNGAILNVCGSQLVPKDAALFSDKLCMSEGYDTRRGQIVDACAAAVGSGDLMNENCEFEIVEAVTRLVEMTDDMTMVTTQVPEIVTPAKKVSDCIASSYDVECAANAFTSTRTAVRNACNTTFTIGADDSVNCLAVQVSVCGGGVYADNPNAPFNPFDAFCDKADTTDTSNPLTIDAKILTSQRIRYCQIGNNADDVAGCAEFLTRSTTLALLAAQTNELDDSPNPTLGQNQFLRGTADGLNTGGFIQKNGDFAVVNKLNLGTATYAGAALGGQAADGVAFFAGREHKTQGDITTDVDYYAGIHSGTDLGAPLPRQYGTAGGDLEVNWNGSIGWLIYDPDESSGYVFGNKTNEFTDFTLTINLTDRTIYAHLVHAASLEGAFGFLLEGDYDENGVISGTARYGPNGGDGLASTLYGGTNNLIGLIGAEGAVGAFHLTGSGAEIAQGAVGGFVVSSSSLAGSDSVVPDEGSFNYWIGNRVDASGNPIAVLETIEEVEGGNPEASFIVGGGSTTALGAYSSGSQRQGILRFSTGSSDGVVFGFDDVGGAEKFYTGLLIDTDLGAPIQQTSGSVTWNGRLAIAKQDAQGTRTGSYLIDRVDFKLKITFTANGGMIDTLTGNDVIEFSRSIYDTPGAKDTFVIAGTFDSQGLLRGTTTYRAFDGNNGATLGGILTGLIGVEGVAGIFASNASGSATVGHYTGGFIASESFGLGNADTWQRNARAVNGTGVLTINDARSAAEADGDYTFIQGGDNTLDLGDNARKSITLTQDLTFDTNLTLPNGDVFSLNSTALGGISFAQATVGANTQFYAGLLSNTFVGAPLDAQPSVNWGGVLGIIAGDSPALYTTNFTLAVNFSTMSVFSNTIFPLLAGNLNHNVIIEGRFNEQGIIYGTATYERGADSNESGVLTGLIGINGAVAVFGGDATSEPGRFIGGLVAVPSGTSIITPSSQFAWAEEIDETIVEGTRFNANVPEVSPDPDEVNLDTTFLGGTDNIDGTQDGFSAFTITEGMDMNEITTRHVGIISGTHLGGPVVDTGSTGLWPAKMAGLIIAGTASTAFEADFTLRVEFNNRIIRADQSDLPTFVLDGVTLGFQFPSAGIGWNVNTGLFAGDITLTADAGAERTKGGVLRGIIGADGAVATFRVSETGAGGRTFVGGFVAVPESIAAARGQTPYWAEYARNADNTAGLDVKGVRTARPNDGTYTVIEGGLETLELGPEVAKNPDADLTYDLTFTNTDVSPDGSTFSFDPTVPGGISFSATETSFTGKYYAGLLSGTDVGRLQSRTEPSATWAGRLAVIYGSSLRDNKLYTEDFELAIDFGERTLKSFLASGTAGVADRITFFTEGTTTADLTIDGEFNDRGIIYGTTAYQLLENGSVDESHTGILTGLIGEKGAAAVFYSSGAGIGVGVYAGGFIAVPNRGEGLTEVYDNTPASYNVWTTRIDDTTQQTATSVAATDPADATNTAAFISKLPETLSETNQISLNLAPLGGDVEDGLIGYAGDAARYVGLLSSTNLNGVPIEIGTARWSGVMQWILSDGGDGVLTQSFTLNVDFDARTVALADAFTFMSNTVSYTLTLGLMPWDLNSGLFTGTVDIAATGQTSAGEVRGLIGKEGLVAAFRSTTASDSSFSGGFVAAESKVSETSFTEYFSSAAGGGLLQATVAGATAKFARANESDLLGATTTTTYKLGEVADSPSGFVVSTEAANFATGILSTTDLGAPLPLTLALSAEWTGKLFISNSAGLKDIVLDVNFAEGTIKTKTAVTAVGSDTVTVDGYFGLNPLALAANLPLGLLRGVVNYNRPAAPTVTPLTLIGQIGADGVVAVFRGAVAGTQIVGGFQAVSSGATANGREFNIRQRAGTSSYRPSGSIDYTPDDGNNRFVVADKNGIIPSFTFGGSTTVVAGELFGLGGDNDPATNPNGFTLGNGTFANVKRIGAGIWGGADLGLLLPKTAGLFATWTGTVQTLKLVHGTLGSVRQSDFTIQVNFENSTISTVADVNDVTGVVTPGTATLDDGDSLLFSSVGFDAKGIIKAAGTLIEYKIQGADTVYRLNLIGLIGQKGALGVFHGNLAAGTAIVGGFEVAPAARMTRPDPNPPRVVVIPPKQINYAAYLDYYQTTYTSTRHGPGINATPIVKLSQFLPSKDDGTGLDTGNATIHYENADNFNPFTIYLNGESAATRNGFVLASTSASSTPESDFRNFAGLLAGADVGRFSDDLKDTTATWSGSFYSSAITAGTGNGRVPVRFAITLNVDFSAGTIGTGGLEVPLLDEHSVNIAGTFGFAKGDITQGLIGGFITYTGPNSNEQRRVTRAPLYGIIGDAGALAVFAGGEYGANGTDGDSPLIGGFEVSPKPVPTASYALFYNYFVKQTNGLQLFNTVTKNSSILAGTATGLVQEGINDPATCDPMPDQCIQRLGYQTIRLGGDKRSNSGFAIMGTKTDSEARGYSFGGLLSGTNLGAVLPVSFGGGVTKAIWHGSFYVTSNKIERPDRFFDTLLHHPLSLTVDLTAGTLQTVDLLGNLGTVALSPTSSVTINGKFGLNPTTANVPYGLLFGDVFFNNDNYKLIGLIGVDGAIGIFRVSTLQTTHVTIGGFEVSPPPPPAYGRGNYATFDDFYHRSKSNTDDLYLSGSNRTIKDQFLRGTPTGLIDPKDTALHGVAGIGSFAPLTVYLGGDVNSGNAFVIESLSGINVAGLLSTTDLGYAPHEGLARATWAGTFYLSSNVNHIAHPSDGNDPRSPRPAPAPLVIKDGVVVDFGAGTITSSQETYTLANGEFASFGIYGKFGTNQDLPLGILGGAIKYGQHATEASIMTADLPLIGVIGREGALGVFRDPSSNNLIGGFEAGISVSYDAFTSSTRAPNIATGISPYLGQHTNGNTAIIRSAIFAVNDAGTDLEIAVLNAGNSPTIREITGYNNVRYGLGDNTASINGFILAGGTLETVPHPDKTGTPHTATELRVVGVGLLPTANLGPAILDVKGSATWAGTAYVIDTIDDTTKVFELKFALNFAAGTFNTAGGTNGTIGVTSKIGADGVPVPLTTGQDGQTLKIAGLFGQGAANQPAGYLASGLVHYNNGVNPALQTNSLYGLIGRGGAIGIFHGGTNNAGANPGFAGGFWASPSTAATVVNYASFTSHYSADIEDAVTGNATPGTAVEFLNGTLSNSTSTSTFRLGGNDALGTNQNGLRFYVANNVKTVGLLPNTNLGAVVPIATASATWYGRLFAKTDAAGFNLDNEKQIGLRVDFGEGTIDTPAPARFTIGAQTHSVSIRGRFGLNSFARDSDVPSATGLLSGFVEYTHHGTDTAVKFDLIGLIGAEGALGIFKGNVAGVGLIGGFEASPDAATYTPNHAAYIKQFGGYINGTVEDDFSSQISKADANALIRTATTRNFNGDGNANVVEQTFRLGGTVTSTDANYGDGFAFVKYIASGDKSVGLLSGTDLGAAVVDTTPTAIWSGRLVVHYDKAVADTKNSQLDLRVDFKAGTIETIAPITIVAYAEGSPAVHKQSLEIKGIFGSHVDAFGLRTGILGGTVEYTVGHYALDTVFRDIPSNVRASAMAHRRATARLPLLGLIGADGAIGVFHGVVADADFGNAAGIVGGFEVSPRAEITTTTASFARWARRATQCESIDISVSTFDFDIECATTKAIIFAHPNDLFLSDEDFSGINTKRQGFVLGNEVGIDLTRTLTPTSGLTLKTLTLGDDVIVNSVGERFTLSDAMGDATDGVAFIGDSFENSIYAGLLSGTDLGAPLGKDKAKASWPGRFAYLLLGSVTEDDDFTLTVDFANMRISGDAPSGFTLQGSYDEYGVITGIIKAKQITTLTGSVSGLIGEQGAVGAFVINTSDQLRVGGFVAAPVAKVTATSYAHFEKHYSAQLNADLTTGGDASLLAGTVNGLNTATATGVTLSTTGAGEFSSTYYLGGGTSGDDGFAILRGRLTGSDTHIYRAGILSGTDLGPVVSARVNGLWTGTAYIIHNYQSATSKTEPFVTVPLNFEVDFTAGTINTVSSLEGFSGVKDEVHIFRVRGLFGRDDLPPGILSGTVTYALASNGTDSSTLELSGLIGADGAIGVFGESDGSLRFAGGFTAQPFALTPAGIAAATPPTAVDVNVLQGYATLPTTGSATSGGFLKLGSTFTNAIADGLLPTDFMRNLDAVSLRNDIEDIGGVGYFAITETDGSGNSFYYYAGILADTDLGAPRTETAGTASWTGQFSEHNSRASTDDFIKFHIDFGLGELQFRNATDTAGDGTLVRGDITYTLNGEFGNGFADANNKIITTGQLGGRITADSDVRGDLTAPISGLIGAKGLVGAFANPDNEGHFAGGFWAVPVLGPVPDTKPLEVTFSDWSDSFGRATPPPTTLIDTEKSRFLTGKATVTVVGGPNEVELDGVGLNESMNLSPCCRLVAGKARFALTFDNARHDGKPLGGAGSAADGVAGFAVGSGGPSNRFLAIYRYAGLLSGTNLGAPISADTPVGAWRGRFVGIRRTTGSFLYRTIADFTLNVTYTEGGGGTLTMANIDDSNTSSDDFYLMTGGRFDASGVISGELNYRRRANGASTLGLLTRGLLTGLIGVDGAVGAFIGGGGTIDDIAAPGSNDARFVGGFVATSVILPDNAPDATMANYANFEYYYTNFGSGERWLSPTFARSGETVKTAFVAGTPTGLNLPASDLPRQKNLTVVKLRGDASSANGFAFVSGNITTNSANERFRVGLLSDTDLGAVFASLPTVLEWKGSVHMLIDASVVSGNGTFTLDFDAGTLTAPAIALGTSTDTIQIAGTFKYGANYPALGAGILGGFASFTDTSETTTTQLPLIGLIGTGGAIGVFHGAVGDVSLVGGFEAAPPLPDPCIAASNCVNHALWLSNALDADGTGTTLRTAIKTEANKTNDTADGHFIAGGADADALLNFSDTTPSTAKLTLSALAGSDDANSGFSALRAFEGTDGTYVYTGLLSDTDVGAPFTSASLPAAKWTAITQGSNSKVSVPFILDVAFTGGTGTIKTKLGGFDYGANANLIINGQFGTNGVIYGNVTVNDPSNFVLNEVGKLSGLIGEDGAVGVFAGKSGTNPFGGGFVASPRPVSVAGTVPWWIENAIDGSDVATARNLGIRAAGDATANDAGFSFATADTARVALGTLSPHDNNAESTLKLGTTNNGFALTYAYFATPCCAVRLYAGILEGTDVGAPFTDSNKPASEWTGFAELYGGATRNYTGATKKAITLDVVFDGTGGTITTKPGGINFATNQDLIIDGKFGTNGVIYGTTDFKYASVGLDILSNVGALSGLIGVNGAVGVFGLANYVGGFVAMPNPSACEMAGDCVNYADWKKDATLTTIVGSEPPTVNAFLSSTGASLDTAGIPGSPTSVNLSTAQFGGADLGGDASDGFSYFTAGGNMFVGIHETTNLGAPLTSTTAGGTWNGSFVSVEVNGFVGTPTTTDFTLGVTFGGASSGNAGSVASGTIGTTGYTFAGEFDANGLITGTTAHGANGAGTMRGLIGAEGAVGVFISNTDATNVYGGGFVARPTP